MCFFDQYIYQCGDFRWGPFRLHCAKEYRAGETCGMKLVMQNIHTHSKCRICNKLEVKYGRKAKEEDRIKRWKSEGGEHRKASIDASQDIIDGLNRDIAKLMLERRDALNKLDRCTTEVYKGEESALSSYRLSMNKCIPELTDLPTRRRLKDSDDKAILEGKLSPTDALLPPEKIALLKLRNESRLVKATWRKKVAPSKHANQSADKKNVLYESRNDDMKTQREGLLLEPRTGKNLDHREAINLDANNSGNIVSPIFSFRC